MKVPATVLGAMKGIGSAALIAVAAAGCGASQPPMKPTTQTPVVLAHQNPTPPVPTPVPTPITNPEPDPEPYEPDLAACGRG